MYMLRRSHITTHHDPKPTVPGRLGFNEAPIAHGNLEHIGIIISDDPKIDTL
jgi:hypothetical protein